MSNQKKGPKIIEKDTREAPQPSKPERPSPPGKKKEK